MILITEVAPPVIATAPVETKAPFILIVPPFGALMVTDVTVPVCPDSIEVALAAFNSIKDTVPKSIVTASGKLKIPTPEPTMVIFPLMLAPLKLTKVAVAASAAAIVTSPPIVVRVE